jgi:DNA-binding MarR family transcriptional regulator
VDENFGHQPSGKGDGTDAVDEVVSDVRRIWPEMEVAGLPITGRLLRLAQFVAAGREQRLAEFGLSVPDFDVLATIRRRVGAGTVNVRDLQHSMMLSSGGITKRLDRLETAGLVERRPDPADRRGVLISLTQAGAALIDEAIPAITTFETAMVSEAIASPQQRRQVEDGLRLLMLAHESSSSTEA